MGTAALEVARVPRTARADGRRAGTLAARQAIASAHARRWFGLAVGSLALSGALALVLVVQRILATAAVPVGDPELAYRSLVVHVNLATGVWLFAFVAALTCLTTSARVYGGQWAVLLAAGGAAAFSLPAVVPGAHAVLSDYVPVIDHWLFLGGLGAFAGGVALIVLEIGLFSWGDGGGALPADVRIGVRASGICFWIALITIGAAYGSVDPAAATLARFQQLFWGGGHVLQFAATAAMLACWLLLLHEVLGESVLAPRAAAWVFGALVAPTAIAPWLVASGQPPRVFTWLMEFAIAPAACVVMIAGGRALMRRRLLGLVHRPPQRAAMVGLAASSTMTLVGFALGAAISGNTTLTPAHYHVSIGAVTVTFMTVLLVLLDRSTASASWRRAAQWQPLAYGAGQAVFAGGLALAGFWGGAARKSYAVAEQVAAPVSRAGFIIAGVGGLLALVAGGAFVVLVVSAYLRGRHAR